MTKVIWLHRDSEKVLIKLKQKKVVGEVKKKLHHWEEQYSIVVDENENLRTGMHEILEKLQDYSGMTLFKD